MNKKFNFHRLYVFLIILVFILFGVLYGTKVYNDFFKKEKEPEKETEVKTLHEIAGYGYKLSDNDLELYKTNFNSLLELLKEEEINYEEYAKTLLNLFIIDYYSLNVRLASTDIGGLEFIHPDQVNNFVINAQENMYKTVQSDLYGDRKQELPIVTNVVIDTITPSKVTYKKVKNDGYKITSTWTYDKELGYEKTGTFYVMKKNDKLYVVSKTGSY